MSLPLVLDRRERQTIVAALRYWRDEMAPYPELQETYLEDSRVPCLNAEEIDALCRELTREPSDGD